MPLSTTQINTVRDNVIASFWQPNPPAPGNNLPRILATEGGPTSQFGFPAPSQFPGTYWQMTQMLRFMVSWYQEFPSDSLMLTRIQQQAAFIADTQYGFNRPNGAGGFYLDDNGLNDSTINVSDDAAWKLLSFCDLHKVTGDPAWLQRAQLVLPKILSVYRDPNGSPTDVGNGVIFSAYGILYGIQYVNARGETVYQATYDTPQSSLYESGIALAALYIYEQTGIQGFREYAVKITDRFIAEATLPDRTSSTASYGLRDRIDNPGAYFQGLHLVGPQINGDQTPLHMPRDLSVAPTINGVRRIARNGGNPYFFQGTIAVGLLCARLYRLTGNTGYLNRIREIVGALSSSSSFLVASDNTLLSNRDPYTAGFFVCEFVREVLYGLRSNNIGDVDTLLGIFASTGLSIATNGIRSSTYYSADWGSPSYPQNGGSSATDTGSSTSWDKNYAAHPGSSTTPADQASALQIMTTANSASMALAGYMAGLRGTTLVDGSQTLSETNGSTLVEG